MIKNYKKSLIEPLSKDELHILHTSSKINEIISNIQRIINQKAHGVYLLGGLRGVGKTSLLNLCLKEVNFGEILRIKVDANRIHNESEFIYIFVDELYDALIDKVEDAEIQIELKNLKEIVIEQRTIKFADSIELNGSHEISKTELTKNNLTLEQGFFGKLFNRQIVVENEKVSSDKKNKSYNNISSVALIERTDDFLLIDKLSGLLKKLSLDFNYTIALSIDELDKKSSLSVKLIFNYYKNLLLNSHVLVFMCVDTLRYVDLTSGNVIDNEYKSYFTDCFYIPTLEYDELVKYLYREFLITDYMEMRIINYLSCGVFRKMNTHQYISRKTDYIHLATSAFHEVIEKVSVKDFFDLYEYDIYKVLLKEVIEMLLKYKRLSEDDIQNFLSMKENEYGFEFEFKSYFLKKFSLIKSLTENFKVCVQFNNKESENVYKVYNSKMLTTNFLNKEKIEFDHEFIGRNINVDIHIQNDNYLPVLIERNNTKAFYYFERFVETLDSRIENIIVVEKIGNWDKNEVQIFSGIVIINKAVGRIAYIIEDCSFSYEGRATYKDILKFLESLSVKKVIVKTDEQPIFENIEYILNKAKSIINGEENSNEIY